MDITPWKLFRRKLPVILCTVWRSKSTHASAGCKRVVLPLLLTVKAGQLPNRQSKAADKHDRQRMCARKEIAL